MPAKKKSKARPKWVPEEGDRVRVRSWDAMLRQYGTDGYGNIAPDPLGVVFAPDMKHLCGREYRCGGFNGYVDSTGQRGLRLRGENEGWQWIAEFLEPADKPTPKKKPARGRR